MIDLKILELLELRQDIQFDDDTIIKYYKDNDAYCIKHINLIDGDCYCSKNKCKALDYWQEIDYFYRYYFEKR